MMIPAASIQAQSTPEISGKWISVKRSDGGLGTAWLFKDQKATYAYGALIESAYKIKDDKLIIETKQAGQTEKITYQLSVDPEYATLINKEKRIVQKMRRMTGSVPNAHPIVGKWAYRHETDRPAFWEFGEDGRALLQVPLEMGRLDYKIEAGKIQFISGAQNRSLSFVIKGNKLSLSDEKGTEDFVSWKTYDQYLDWTKGLQSTDVQSALALLPVADESSGNLTS